MLVGRRGEVRDSASLSRRGSGGARTEWDGCAIKCVSRCRYRASLLRSTPFLASCTTLASAAVPLLLRARLSAHSLAGSCSFSVVQCLHSFTSSLTNNAHVTTFPAEFCRTTDRERIFSCPWCFSDLRNLDFSRQVLDSPCHRVPGVLFQSDSLFCYVSLEFLDCH